MPAASTPTRLRPSNLIEPSVIVPRWAANVRLQSYRGAPALTYWEGKVIDPGFGQGEGVILDSGYRELALHPYGILRCVVDAGAFVKGEWGAEIVDALAHGIVEVLRDNPGLRQ